MSGYTGEHKLPSQLELFILKRHSFIDVCHAGMSAQSVIVEVDVSTLQSGVRMSCGLMASSIAHVDQLRTGRKKAEKASANVS